MERILTILPHRRQPQWLRILLSLLVISTLCIFQVGMYQYAGFTGFFLLLPGIFFCGFVFNRGSAFIATFVGIALATYLMWSGLPDVHALVPLTLFALVGIGTAFVSEGLRKVLERLADAEQSKELLLQELAHRTKNNMMRIQSLLRMQAQATSNAKVKAGLEAAANRVRVMADVHDYLQPKSKGELVNIRPYLEELCTKLAESVRGIRPIAVRVSSDDVVLPQQSAVAVAMIVNELVTNSFKYAFPGDRAGLIEIRVRRNGQLEVQVRDNGVGCPKEVGGGLGSRLMQLMTEQLGGTLVRAAANPGHDVTLQIPTNPGRA